MKLTAADVDRAWRVYERQSRYVERDSAAETAAWERYMKVIRQWRAQEEA